VLLAQAHVTALWLWSSGAPALRLWLCWLWLSDPALALEVPGSLALWPWLAPLALALAFW